MLVKPFQFWFIAVLPSKPSIQVHTKILAIVGYCRQSLKDQGYRRKLRGNFWSRSDFAGIGFSYGVYENRLLEIIKNAADLSILIHTIHTNFVKIALTGLLLTISRLCGPILSVLLRRILRDLF